MSTKFAQMYAALTIGYLEEKTYSIIEAKHDTDLYHNLKKKYWKRFLALYPGLQLKNN